MQQYMFYANKEVTKNFSLEGEKRNVLKLLMVLQCKKNTHKHGA